MTRFLTATAIGLAITVAGCAQQSASTGAAPTAAVAQTTAAKRVDNFRLTDHTGRALELYRMKDASAIVMVMQGVDCPASATLEQQLEAMKATYASKGVEFMMINSNLKETPAAVAAHATKLNLSVPVLKDELQLVGDQIGATKTTEVFVIDPKTWKIMYQGGMDAAAIDAVVSGQPVPVAKPVAGGCDISFPDRSAASRAAFQNISYSSTVAPIIEEKCVACHQEGSIAPFSFNSYEMVKGFAPMIREVIRTDRMPPWDADPHVGKFKDDKSLTGDQIKTLVRWVEAGAPRGDGPDPLAATRHVAPDWPLGEPDLIVDIPKYTVPASGVVDYQYPIVPNPLKEGKWVKASTAKVSQRQAVHHILSGYLAPGDDFGSSMSALGGSVGGYTVGMESVVQPKGIGTYIPPGGSFGYQMHYTPFGKEVVSAEQIGLYFYKDGEKPDLIMREMPLVDQFIKIPPNDGNHKEVAYFNFPKDAILHTAVVHAHYRGTYSKLELRYPNGEQKTILNVPFYDFNWQRMYEFAEPIDVPAGSKLIATYIYDNSARNPANPDPSKEITWGDQSFEEMFYTSLRYRWKDETAAEQKNYDDLLQQTRLMGMLDDNIDDKIQVEELRGPFERLKPQFALADANKDGGIDASELEPVLKMLSNGRRRGGDSSGN
ncbi:redoxin domain-containing protein [bacterium]|nr:redoxin domain-containing protein [bacterium]